jgi:hypothetical protein
MSIINKFNDFHLFFCQQTNFYEDKHINVMRIRKQMLKIAEQVENVENKYKTTLSGCQKSIKLFDFCH